MPKLAVVRTHSLDDPDTLPIVKGLPIPARYKGYPMTKVGKTMRALNVGDSFQLRATTKGVGGLHKMAERIGITIETRRIGDFRRVWRVR